MSRVKKAKMRNKKKIRETILGLSLAIFIGVAGSAGSYAYFSDRVNSDNSIKITMGTLEVATGEGFNFDIDGSKIDDKYFDDVTKNFEIKNKGTLDEILTLKFENISINGNMNHPDLDKIKYKLEIRDENNNVVYSLGDDSKLKDLLGKEIKLGRLNSGKILKCIAKVDDEGISNNYEQDTVIKFDLVVEGVQINDKSVKGGGVN